MGAETQGHGPSSVAFPVVLAGSNQDWTGTHMDAGIADSAGPESAHPNSLPFKSATLLSQGPFVLSGNPKFQSLRHSWPQNSHSLLNVGIIWEF